MVDPKKKFVGKGRVFSNLITTDDYCANVVIYKRLDSTNKSSNDYTVEDLRLALKDESIEDFSLTSIGPGRSVISTAASSNGKDEYSIKRVTRKEYNTYSGSRGITKKRRRKSERRRRAKFDHE